MAKTLDDHRTRRVSDSIKHDQDEDWAAYLGGIELLEVLNDGYGSFKNL